MSRFLRLGRLWQDIQYGCRQLAGSPGFATIAVLSLAIGIGANCAIFSFADALLLRPLPVARPGEVLTTANGGGGRLFAPARFSEDRCVGGSLDATAKTGRATRWARHGFKGHPLQQIKASGCARGSIRVCSARAALRLAQSAPILP